LERSFPLLSDIYSRHFGYLRLSVTDACNFKCGYCLPDGYKCTTRKRFLTPAEIRNLVAGFVELGLKKIRLTGGEPTLRLDIIDIISEIKANHPHLQVALTTNAYRLQGMLPRLRDAGLNAVNISLDSLNSAAFKNACGVDECENVKGAVDAAWRMGIKTKINAVLLKGINDDELGEFMSWIRDRDVAIRFIELMQTKDNVDYFKRHHLSTAPLLAALKEGSWAVREKSEQDGPAVELRHKDFAGRLGVIAPYSKDFCASCNRLRVSSTGGLRLCLFGEGDVDIRQHLQDSTQRPELIQAIRDALVHKPKTHRLHEKLSGNMHSLSAIGG
jgi:GTP 3',8-cyclase